MKAKKKEIIFGASAKKTRKKRSFQLFLKKNNSVLSEKDSDRYRFLRNQTGKPVFSFDFAQETPLPECTRR
ncbi:MAG: hypothetical protein K8S87_06670 [Planctomycetes bacterium]|nr:hypothetical protein [Planctomycetota bacterium]